MKKFISLILAVMLLASVSIPAFAREAGSSPDFYVSTASVPQEAIDHVQSCIGSMIDDLYDLNSVTIGTPFKIHNSNSELYYFVIYDNHEIVGTYRVYEINGRYTGIFNESASAIAGFETVAALTSHDSPAKIIAGNSNNLYALIGSDIYPIFQYPTDCGADASSINTLSSHITSDELESVVNVSDGISFDIPITRSSPPYKFLQIGWAETQASGESWCMAYTTASILRFKTGNGVDTINARSIMEWAYPDLSLSDLKKEALSTSEADKFANTFGINPSHTSSRRSYSQVVSDIKADNPLVFICDNLTTGKKAAHAFVCRGYDDNNGNSFYSVWNPWYDEFERIYTSDNIYTNFDASAKYQWSSTMYSWD